MSLQKNRQIDGLSVIFSMDVTPYLPLTLIAPETVCKQDAGIRIIHKLPVGVPVKCYMIFTAREN